jgi:hypothetical protein
LIFRQERPPGHMALSDFCDMRHLAVSVTASRSTILSITSVCRLRVETAHVVLGGESWFRNALYDVRLAMSSRRRVPRDNQRESAYCLT